MMPFLDPRSPVSPAVSQVHLEGAWKGLCDRQGQGPGTSRSSRPDSQRPPLGGLLPHPGAQPTFPGGSPPSAPGASQSRWGGWKLLEASRGKHGGEASPEGRTVCPEPPLPGAQSASLRAEPGSGLRRCPPRCSVPALLLWGLSPPLFLGLSLSQQRCVSILCYFVSVVPSFSLHLGPPP